MFPSILTPLLNKCGVTTDGQVAAHAFFGPSADIRFVRTHFLCDYFLLKRLGFMNIVTI